MKIEFILNEGKIEDLVKKYPDKLKSVYERGLLNNIKPVFVEWMVKQGEPIEDIIGLIPVFINNINNLEQKDINKYTSSELRYALENMKKSNRIKISKEDADVLGQAGAWKVVVPLTREGSIYYGRNTTWCTAASKSQNLFLSYVARKNHNIMLFYIIDTSKPETERDPNSKICIGYINNEMIANKQNGGLTVNSNNDGLDLHNIKNILSSSFEEVMRLINKYINTTKEHPAKKRMIILSQDVNKLKEYLKTLTDTEVKDDFVNQLINYGISVDVYRYISQNRNDIKQKIAEKNDTSLDILKEMAVDKESFLRTIVALHPNASTDILTLLSKDEITYIKYNVSINPNTPINILYDFFKEDKEYLNEGLSRNPNTPSEILNALSKNKNNSSYLRDVAKNPNTSKTTLMDIYFKLLNHYKLLPKRDKEDWYHSEDVYNKRMEIYRIIGSIFENPNLPDSIIKSVSLNVPEMKEYYPDIFSTFEKNEIQNESFQKDLIKLIKESVKKHNIKIEFILKESSNNTWYHSTTANNWMSIKEQGLLINSKHNFSIGSLSYMKDIYGCIPIFLSKNINERYDDEILLSVDVTGLSLVVDIPTLASEYGAYLSEDSLYFSDGELSEYDDILYSDIITPDGFMVDELINLTTTAACMNNIDINRIKRIK